MTKKTKQSKPKSSAKQRSAEWERNARKSLKQKNTAPPVKRDVIRHKDGSVTYKLPDDRRKFVADTDAETEVTLPPGKLPKFTCADCGSIDPKLHAASCNIVMSAHKMDVNFMTYSNDPSLWCVVVSGHEGDPDTEKVRCALHAGHDGLHGFPTSLSAREHQQRISAVKDAKKRPQTIVQEHARRERTPRAPGEPRAPRGAGKEIMSKTIKVLVKENPRREGTARHAMFAALKDGDTVEQYMKKSGAPVAVVLKSIAKKWIEVA